MKNSITVSVVMITYNHEKYIEEAVLGVLMQEGNFKVELIIADDNSPDQTESIIRKIQSNHPNGKWIRYTRHAKNMGMMPNFIWALNQANGEYIALCEGDDYWTDPLKLQKQIDFLENNAEYVACFHDSYKLLNGRFLEYYNTKSYLKDKILTPKHMIKADGMGFPTAALVYRNINLSFPKFYVKMLAGDLGLMYLLMDKGLFYYMDEKMCVYRKHEGGVSYSHSAFKKIVMNNLKMIYHFNNYYRFKYFFPYSRAFMVKVYGYIYLTIKNKY